MPPPPPPPLPPVPTALTVAAFTLKQALEDQREHILEVRALEKDHLFFRSRVLQRTHSLRLQLNSGPLGLDMPFWEEKLLWAVQEQYWQHYWKYHWRYVGDPDAPGVPEMEAARWRARVCLLDDQVLGIASASFNSQFCEECESLRSWRF
ncbi:MAG: hypothetical protein MMC33_008565 [Icmadophila ericetorum]|nr:hypothetical protein [Icmadophila ericetorum]